MACSQWRAKSDRVPFLHVDHPAFRNGGHKLSSSQVSQIETAFCTATDLLALSDVPGTLSQQEFIHVIHEAFKANSNDFGEAAAVEWAAGFTIPKGAVQRDTDALLRHELNVGKFINEKRLYSASSRFSVERITETLGEKGGTQLSDPLDIIRLHRLAGGIQIPTAPSFQPMPTPPPLRQKYVAVHPAS
eukprot:gene32727-40394_t